MGGIIGNLDKAFMHGVDLNSPFPGNHKLPEFVFMAYQMMFAIITPALITGAFVNRITFKAYLVFLVLWQLLVYYPFAHMVWGGGLLAHMGVLDFAGGIVVHATAGFAALASVFYVGQRRDKASPPNSVPLIAIGTGLLWFGWYGFNAGSELDVNADHGPGIPEYGCGGFLRGDRVARDRVECAAPAEVCGPAHGRGRGAGDDHAGGGICFAPFGGHHRHGGRSRLLSRGAFEEQARLGRCARCLGRARRGRRARRDHARRVRFEGNERRAGRMACSRAAAISFSCRPWRCIGGSLYAFLFTYLMLALINLLTPVKVSEADEDLGLTPRCTASRLTISGTL